MDVCMRLAAGSLDVYRVYLEQPAEDYGALLLWPAEGGEVEVPPSSATQGHCTGLITATPWAQEPSYPSHSTAMARNQWQALQETVAGLTQAVQNVVQAGNQAGAARNGAGDLHWNFRSFNPPRFSGSSDLDEAENWQEEIERIFQETKAAEFAALKQKGMSVAEYEAQFAPLVVYAPHLVGTERLKANRFMDGLRPIFIERLGPHNIQTYTEIVQRAQLVEDTMAKVEGMRGKDISKPTFTKRGAVDTTGTFPNNNDNNNKRSTTGKDYGIEKKIIVEETMMVKYCKFCNKLGHQADKCWKKAGACLRCGSHEHRILSCPMLKDQDGRNQGVVKRQGRVNAITPAELPDGGMSIKPLD
ncbi:hypothetical protein Taro_034009 [Colocasia esculenta]|uniref:CCHC-type domain-containing protein n=1 Tax=Colocasia esculenta TaxID=4460 RepID=A0A843VZI9_COLES|nr:hypothetical protein [Colocasia esculenta]